MTDLRAFLDHLAQVRPRDILAIDREVRPRYETTAILTKLEEHGRSPLLRFNNVAGTDVPVVTNVCGSMGRLALALSCPLKDVARLFGERAQVPIPPRVVANAACQANVLRGDDVDLGILPRLVYHLDDADEPYITAAIVIARDPETRKTNLSYHRLMLAGRNRTAIFMEKGRHLAGIFNKHRAAGTDMPIAVFIGVHPLTSLGALYAGAADDEEYDVIGGLMQAALDVVPCVTNPDLCVPAGSEFVLEGSVSVSETIREGPFGEFTGYGTGATTCPVFTVAALTHRDDPLFQDVVSGRMEHLILSMPALEHRTLREAKKAVPGVARVALVAPLTAVIAVDKRDDAEPKMIIDALLSDIYSKHVIVVDADVDPSDTRAVLAAMALQTQADAKIHVYPDQLGTALDPSCSGEDGRSAKMGIDATRPLQPRRVVTRNRVPQDLLDSIDVRDLLGSRKPSR